MHAVLLRALPQSTGATGGTDHAGSADPFRNHYRGVHCTSSLENVEGNASAHEHDLGTAGDNGCCCATCTCHNQMERPCRTLRGRRSSNWGRRRHNDSQSSHVTMDLPNRSLLVKANPISVLISFGVLAIRFTTRSASLGHGLLLTECATASLICLAACMIISTRFDWYLQYRRAEQNQPNSPVLDTFGNTIG